MHNQSASGAIRPNLLLVGAARSGTTAMCEFLATHPDIFITDPKEPQFLALGHNRGSFNGPTDRQSFDRQRVTDPAEYLGLFEGSSTSTVRGEGSVSTLYYPDESIPRIREFCDPDVRFIALLRDPVERAYSSYLFQRSRGLEPIDDFGRALDQEDQRVRDGWNHLWHYTRMSRYSQQLPRFIEAFGRDRVLVLLHDDFAKRPAETLRSIFTFLGVPQISIDTSTAINFSGEPKNQALQRVVRLVQTTPMLRTLEVKLVPRRLRQRLRAASLTHPPLDPQVRSRLEAELALDIEYFAQLAQERDARGSCA